MQAILNSVRDGANWVADALDDLLTDTALGFGAAAPFVTDRDCEAGAAQGDR